MATMAVALDRNLFLAYYSSLIYNSLHLYHHVLAVLIDFERAYHMLHVPTLLKKLLNMGIMGKTYHWIETILIDRTFQVKVGASLSETHSLENGTPQGSIISPILFLIVIKGIPHGLDGVEIFFLTTAPSMQATVSTVNCIIKSSCL